VYSIKRHYDPRWKSQNLYAFENAKLAGLTELRKRALDEKKPFDYDTPVDGARALDRYTFQLKLGETDPRFVQNFAFASGVGAVAREVVEMYGDKVGEHPVGTGPFILQEWRRSSRITLVRNPNYRETLYDEHPPEGDARLQAIAAQFKGRRLPMVDKVVISIIEEPQPRWLSFLNGEHDVMDQLPNDFAPGVMPNNKLAPYLAKRGLQLIRYLRSDIAISYFAMEDPVVGGYEPHKVALRRAISLGVDLEREIRLARRGQAIPAQGMIGPNTFGYDPAFKSEMGEFDIGRAKALLDMHGYIDRDGDGWREQPDGKPMVIEYATQPDGTSRQLVEQWQRNMQAIGIKMEFKVAKWPENLKSSRNGKLMMWGLGWSVSSPDGEGFLAPAYGPNKGGANHSRFALPAFDRLYEQVQRMPDSPERLKVMQDAMRTLVAYMPYKIHVHRYFSDLTQPWVLAYNRNMAVRAFWQYVDIDEAELARRTAAR
jgi:ABC-type transport system substrate-binding protein